MNQSDTGKVAARLRTAMDLCDLGPELVRQRMYRENPLASEKEIVALLRTYYAFRPGAEHGDGMGRPGTWPRRR